MSKCKFYSSYVKVIKTAKIRNWYNQVPHQTQDTTWESEKNTIKHHKQEPKPYLSPLCPWFEHHQIRMFLTNLYVCLFIVTKIIAKSQFSQITFREISRLNRTSPSRIGANLFFIKIYYVITAWTTYGFTSRKCWQIEKWYTFKNGTFCEFS